MSPRLVARLNVIRTPKYTDALLRDITKEHSDRIIQMDKAGVSYTKIQKQLSAELIKENVIPATIKRQSRKKNDNNKIVEKDTLLPIRTIKEVIQNYKVLNTIEYIK